MKMENVYQSLLVYSYSHIEFIFPLKRNMFLLILQNSEYLILIIRKGR